MSDVRIAQKGNEDERRLQEQAIARLVANVVDEAHWQQILATAGPEQAAELERVVGPMLPFRRSRRCTTPDCTSGHEGIWQPVLEVVHPFTADKAWVPIELHLCPSCKAQAQLSDFLTDTVWAQVLLAWDDPHFPPLRRMTGLVWERVQ